MPYIATMVDLNTPKPAGLGEVKMAYLQSFQQAEVLKGSPLDNADLIVLQMTVAVDRETKRSMLLKIRTEKNKKKQTAQKQNQQKGFRGTAKPNHRRNNWKMKTSDRGWGRELHFPPQTETTAINTETNADSSENHLYNQEISVVSKESCHEAKCRKFSEL